MQKTNVTKKEIKAIWGHIWLQNSTEISYEGQSTNFENIDFVSNIKSIGAHEIGAEANLFIEFVDGTELEIHSLKAVKEFVKQYK